jgi:ATP-binding cassette subfamily B protein
MSPPDLYEEQTLGKAYDSRLMWRLLRYVAPYKGRATLAVALIVVSSVLQLVGPLATAVALDLYVRPLVGGEQEQTISAASRWFAGLLAARGYDLAPSEGIALTGLIYLATLFLTFFILYAQSYVMQVMGQRIMFDLRRQIFAHLQRLPISHFDRNPIGRLVTRSTTDVDALNELFTAGIVSIFGDVVLLGGIVLVLFWLNWKLALVAFAIVPLLLGLTVWFKSKARHWYREVRVRIARINAFLQEHITGMAVVQLFNREERSFDEFHAINEDHRDANVSAIFYYAVYYPGVELITALGTGLIVWYGGGRVLAGALSLGGLIAFLQYAQRFYRPLADLSDKYNILQAAMASSERIFQLLDERPRITSPAEAYAPEAVRGAIELEAVSFSYLPEERVLHDVSFRIEPGETVAVVGHTGAGKSTLANLLLRFYDVDSGAVKIDGVDVRQWELSRLRESIGLVLQDVFLFSGSLAHNLRLGADEISDERLRWALSEVRALDFVEALPGGLEAAVRERGAGLSVGQKQLVSFARALAFDPRILILDEATSSVDTETEQRIQQAVDRLLGRRSGQDGAARPRRTSLVIAHRLSTIQKADRILVFHKGRLREQGTHQELMALRGIYYRLYLLQYQDDARALA